MRKKRILAAAVSLAVAAGQFGTVAFADNDNGTDTTVSTGENSAPTDDAATSDEETTGENDLGDINGDGRINITDVSALAAHIKGVKALNKRSLAAADINADGRVTVTDLGILAGHIKGLSSIKSKTQLPIVKNPREEMQDKVQLIEFSVDKNTKTVSWNAVKDMKQYVVVITNGEKTVTQTTEKLSVDIPYDMFRDGKLTVMVAPFRTVQTEDGKRTYDYGDTIGYALCIKPDMIHGTITVTDDKGKAKIDWKAADFASGYHVYDITNTAKDGKPKLIADTATNQLITDFPVNATVKMLIVPFNSVGEAEGVNAEMIGGNGGGTTKPDPDPKPDPKPETKLAAPTINSNYYYSDLNSVTFYWNAVKDAEGYEASIAVNSSETVTREIKTTTCTIDGLPQRKEMTVKVRATGGTHQIKHKDVVIEVLENIPAGTKVTIIAHGSTTKAPVRSGTGTGSEKIGTAIPGQKFDLLGKTGSWYKINFGGKPGFVYYWFVTQDPLPDPVAPAEVPGPDPDPAAKLTVKGGTFMYDGMVHKVTYKLENGTGLTVEFSTDGGKTWSTKVPGLADPGTLTVKTRATGGKVVLNAKDVTITVTRVAPAGTAITIVAHNGTTKAPVRSGPSNGSPKIGSLDAGTHGTLVSQTGSWIKVKGAAIFDTFEKEVSIQSVQGIMSIPAVEKKREDNAEKKRVELHCHTKMSDMDGVSECKDLVKRAYAWGMPAIAITDHGNVQAFPDANHVREALLSSENKKRKEEGLSPVDPQKFFKVIYGVECYLVDDLKKSVELGAGEKPEDALDAHKYVVFDLETTGFSPEKNRIIEFGAVKVENGKITGRFSEFVNPGIPIPYRITQLTGITDDMVIDADPIEKVLPGFLEFSEGCVLVGHNVGFDIGFVRENCRRLGYDCPFTTMDTLGISRALLPGHAKYTLDAVAKILGVSLENHHRAVDDAECTAGIFRKLLPMLEERGADTFEKVNALSDSNQDIIKRLRTHHCVLLAKNNTGRVNLYTLISDSHLKYFFKKPRIPKSLLMKHREGILVGSACVSGELFEAILEERGDEAVAGIADFYDYLEIQPRDNNRFLLESPRMQGRYPQIKTEEDLLDLNRRIVKLGEQLGKPVVATGDVHFMDPEDEIYRSIIQDGMGMSDEDPAPLYLRTTEDMLQEFSYLGAQKAEEVVITNTQKIADMIDAISPVRPDKCPPIIPHSDEMLTEICYNKAHSMYGDPLPPIVEERLQRELGSIIKNGYSVMYIIAQKLVWKSVEDGYLVGSRGSVGSSFVATMSGITEVNPLPPHYYCTECHFSDFDSPEVKAYAGRCGIDLPPRMCPRCGKPLKKDGFDIPFETFLGFKGDKEPDIDLNFSGEYQSKAHAYTKVIFGHEQTFKAGTIATVAEKTAYGYVKNYFERKGLAKRNCEIERSSVCCRAVRGSAAAQVSTRAGS